MEQRAGNQAAAERFAMEFGSCFANAITERCGFEVTFSVLDSPDLSKRPGDAVHFRVSVNSAEYGECFIEMFKPGILALGSRILREETSSHEHSTNAVEDVIAKALLELKDKLIPEYGDVVLKVDRVSDLVFGGMFVVPLEGVGPDGSIPVLLYFSSGFGEAIAGTDTYSRSARSSCAGSSARNLDLVMGVELNVSLRFGQRQMPLREVLELESGSVIELDRRVDDPVELLLDGKVIAIGEAVIVDGNYGLRVTKVSHPIATQWN